MLDPSLRPSFCTNASNEEAVDDDVAAASFVNKINQSTLSSRIAVRKVDASKVRTAGTAETEKGDAANDVEEKKVMHIAANRMCASSILCCCRTKRSTY